MALHEAILLTVEAPARGVRVVRLTGELDVAAGRRIAGLAEVQLQRIAGEIADGNGSGHLLLCLAGVRSFRPGGPQALTAVRAKGRAHGVEVHLTGLSGRQLLPGQVTSLLHRMSHYPTVECALQKLSA